MTNDVAGELLKDGREPDLRRVMDQVPDPFAVLDRRWRIVYANPAATSMLGGESVLGSVVWELFPAAVGSEMHREFGRAMESGEPVDLMLRPREFGIATDAWFSLRAYPLEEGLAVVGWDATPEKEARVEREELLRSKSEIARVLQEALLPPALPEIPGAEVGASYVAAGEGMEVGGDFYDVFSIQRDGWALVMGDVTGKGPEAASLTSLARHTIRAAAMRVKRPWLVLETLNEEILHQTGGERLFTAVYGELEPRRADGGGALLRVACAGHPSPVVVGRGGAAELLPDTGTILGAFKEPRLARREIKLERGSTVVFYTDGVTEARDRQGRFFGTQRLLNAASGCAALPPSEAADRIKSEALTFQGGVAADDIAVLVLRVR